MKIRSVGDSLLSSAQEEAEYYLHKWAPLLQAGLARAGFNWAAFFLAGFWLGYRKMYKVALIFYAIITVESVFEKVVFVGVMGKPRPPGLGVGRQSCGVANLWSVRQSLVLISRARGSLRTQSRGSPRGRLVGKAI